MAIGDLAAPHIPLLVYNTVDPESLGGASFCASSDSLPSGLRPIRETQKPNSAASTTPINARLTNATSN